DVFGSGTAAYRSRAQFDGGAILATACSCPMQRACKHVVAAMLVAADSESERAAAEDRQRDAKRASWRRLVPQAPASRPIAALALGVELRVRPSRTVDRWGAAAARTATPRELVREHGEVQLAVRPL